jgi:hypothetical protein
MGIWSVAFFVDAYSFPLSTAAPVKEKFTIVTFMGREICAAYSRRKLDRKFIIKKKQTNCSSRFREQIFRLDRVTKSMVDRVADNKRLGGGGGVTQKY